MTSRFLDVINEDGKILLPIEGYQNVDLLPLEQALLPVAHLFDPDSLRSNIWVAKQRSEYPPNGLSTDESASIILYTIEWTLNNHSLYYILNQTLRLEDRKKLKPWFAYLKLILTALSKLPSVTKTVYRGVRDDLTLQYPCGKELVWWGFSSCTDTMNVLESEQFCGKNGSRTIFSIECLNGKSITQHSYYKTEDEILLLPAIYFKVHSQFDAGNGLYIIQLKEIKPPCVLLPPADKIPTWKQFNSGICLEGTCKNCGCEAYNQTVIMPIGFRRFDLLTDVNEVTTKCPVCTSYVEVERCAFNNCLWRWEGIKQNRPLEAPSSSVSDWKRADNYIHFEQELNEHVRWRKLVLEAKAITT